MTFDYDVALTKMHFWKKKIRYNSDFLFQQNRSFSSSGKYKSHLNEWHFGLPKGEKKCPSIPANAFQADWPNGVVTVVLVQRAVSAPGPATSNAAKSDSRTERSLEESRKLILEWANELRHVDKVRPGAADLTGDVSQEKPHALTEVVEGKPCSPEAEEPNKDLDANEDAQLRVMEWAKEVQKVSEVRNRLKKKNHMLDAGEPSWCELRSFMSRCRVLHQYVAAMLISLSRSMVFGLLC